MSLKNGNTDATQNHGFHKVHGCPPPAGHPRCPPSLVPRAQGCQCSGSGAGVSRGPEREKQTQRNHCLGRARGAGGGPPPAVGPRALSPRLWVGAWTPALQPRPAGQPWGDKDTGRCGGAQAVAGSSPGTRAVLVKRGLQGKDTARRFWARLSPTRVCDPERLPSTSVRNEGAMGWGLFGSPGGDPAPSPGCHTPTHPSGDRGSSQCALSR